MKNLSSADNYYVKALDYYPYGLEEVLENLNYALSYDEEHGPANCLMGMLYMYKLKIYSEATYYFQRAICSDLDFPDSYKHLSLLNIWMGEYSKAEKLIQFGMRVKGVDKSELLRNRAMISEINGDLLSSKRHLKLARN